MTTPRQYRISWAVVILVTVALAVLSTIYSLTHGIHEVFPFLYFLPIIIFVYQYPKRGVLFSLAISSIFLVLVYYYGNLDATLIAVSTAWFVMFVTIGVVTSSFAEGLMAEERKYRGIFENSQAGILTFDSQSQNIRDVN
jgi:glucose-6-phosphate-specific signal transduction histidine kinase